MSTVVETGLSSCSVFVVVHISRVQCGAYRSFCVYNMERRNRFELYYMSVHVDVVCPNAALVFCSAAPLA